MAEIPSRSEEKLSAVETVRLEMSGHVRSLAAPANPGESVKACIRRVSHRTGLGFSQVKRLWYSEWKIIPAHVADKIRNSVEAKNREIDRQIEELKARQAQFYALTHQSQDQEFYRVRSASPQFGDPDIGGTD